MSVVSPNEVRLSIDGGHYVIVKAELNYGETIAMYAQMRSAEHDGADPLKVGPALVQAYLLDWSLTDNDGRILSVRQQPPDVVAAALHHLPFDEGQAVVDAIRAHDAALTAAREEKKLRTGAPESSHNSPLRVVATGASSG